MHKDRNRKLLRPVRPNVGVEMAFRKRLNALIDEMNASVKYWLLAAYKANEPKIVAAVAMDAVPANELRDAMAKLSKQWLYRFNEAAAKLAEYFATDVADRTDGALWSALRQMGITVSFKLTPAMRDILNATVHENISLIKSIPQQYLTAVEGTVMRSVQMGNDLQQLTGELQRHYGVTKRRAAIIARDQNNKANSAMTRARQTELGITEAIWMHSHAGKTPRPTHVKMDGRRYDVKQGMYDPAEGRRIFPGELINCRCTSRSVIPGIE